METGKNMSKNIIGKYVSKNLSVKCRQTFLDQANNLLQMRLKLIQKKQFKKPQRQQVI